MVFCVKKGKKNFFFGGVFFFSLIQCGVTIVLVTGYDGYKGKTFRRQIFINYHMLFTILSLISFIEIIDDYRAISHDPFIFHIPFGLRSNNISSRGVMNKFTIYYISDTYLL